MPERWLLRRLPPPLDRNGLLLTFDDGPTPGVTEAVLERLERHGARAVFFMLGRHAARHPDLARAVAAAGHPVGNHSHDHDMSRWQAPWRWWTDLRRAGRALAAAGVPAPRFYRPPGGRITPLTVAGPPLLGLRTVLWSVDSDDWRDRDPAAARALGRRLAESVAPGDIVLCHDIRPANAMLLDELLPRLADRGLDLAGPAAALAGGAA